MNNKRFFVSWAIVLLGSMVSLLLVAALASAQPEHRDIDLPIPAGTDVFTKAGLANDQAFTVTFPTGEWPWYAQEEIFIHPEPPMAGQPAELCAEVINHNLEEPWPAVLEFGFAPLGIGLPFEPAGLAEIEVPPGGAAVGCVVWVPPDDRPWSIQVLLRQPGVALVQESQRNIDMAEPLKPNVQHILTFPVANPTNSEITVSLGLANESPDWAIELSQYTISHLGPGDEQNVDLIVTPPNDLPQDRHLIVDVEAYNEIQLMGGFRKIFRPPVPLHRTRDPFFAESEIQVWPYPPRAGEPTQLCVELFNWSDEPQTIEALFSVADFGIGLPFDPVEGPVRVTIPPKSRETVCITWVPPEGGHFCVQVELIIDGDVPYPNQFSQRNLDVAEPLQPTVPHTTTLKIGNFFNPFTNPNPETIDVSLQADVILPGWNVQLDPMTLPQLEPDEVRPVTMTVTPPPELPMVDLAPIVDVLAFAENAGEPHLLGGIRKFFQPPVPLHPFPDPPYAEREISVTPYPPNAGEPTEVCVDLRNPTSLPQDVTVYFAWSGFGIGLPFTPINGPRQVHLPPYSLVRECLHWIPPMEGQVCIEVALEMDGYAPQRSRLNLDVNEVLEPNVPNPLTFLVGNTFAEPVTISLGLIPHLDGWQYELSEDVLTAVDPGSTRPVTLMVTPPEELPPDGTPVLDVEAFAEGELIGGIRKIYRPPIPIHRPKDPIYAESEIGIDPYPVLAGQPTVLSVEVFNPTDKDRIVTATFSVASFGIGLPFSTNHITPNPISIFVPSNGAARGHVTWSPPAFAGKFCVMVTLEMEGHEPVWSQRNIDVGEPLELAVPHSLDFPVGNTAADPVTITMGLVNHRDWGTVLSQDILPNVQPGDQITVSLTVTAPEEAVLGTGEPIVDVEAYVDGMLIGGFRKMDRPPVPLHKPHEKSYAESEIMIDPYPPQVGVESRVSTVVQNTSDEWMTVNLEFGWAKFGMGIPFTTTGMSPSARSVTLGPGLTETVSVGWEPELSGPQCVQIRLTDGDERYEPQESQRNIDVAERPPCGETKVFSFTVYNDQPIAVTVDIGKITFNVPADWQITTVPSDKLVLGPYAEGVVLVKVKIPCSINAMALQNMKKIAELQQVAGSNPLVDVEGYVNGDLVGGIEILFAAVGEPEGGDLYLPIFFKKLG